VRTVYNSQNQDFLYDLNGKTIDQLTAGSLTRSEAYAGGMHVATYASGTPYFDSSDWLGTYRVRTNVSGASVESCTSLPFGEDLTCTAADVTPLHFTSQEQDAGSGDVHFPFRYYSGTMARFLTPDPAGLAAVDPTNQQSWNLYAYVLNNPLSYIDPLGLDCIYTNDDGSVDHVVDGDCDSPTDNGYYVDGRILGGIGGINTYLQGPENTLNFYILGQANPTSLCISDCTGAIGSASDTFTDPNGILTNLSSNLNFALSFTKSFFTFAGGPGNVPTCAGQALSHIGRNFESVHARRVNSHRRCGSCGTGGGNKSRDSADAGRNRCLHRDKRIDRATSIKRRSSNGGRRSRRCGRSRRASKSRCSNSCGGLRSHK